MNNNKTKRIGIDARFYGPIGKGLGRYTQEIVDNILRLDKKNQYVIFLSKENYDLFNCDGIRVKKVLTDVRWYSLAEQLIMPFYIRREQLDLMHFPHFNIPLFCPVKFIVTIHDLILIKFPTKRATTLGPLLYKIKNLAYKAVIKQAVKRAKKIISVSEFTKNEIIKYFKIDPAKIITTYEGVADSVGPTLPPSCLRQGFGGQAGHLPLVRGETQGEYSKEIIADKNLLSNYNITKPLLLYVGNAYPHKNLEGLIRVFAGIYNANEYASAFAPSGASTVAEVMVDTSADKNNTNNTNEKMQLVLVGKEDYFYKRLKNYATGFKVPIIFPGYVNDMELKIFYKKALAYIFPSFYEGFGLPPLEAMANGCPVISSNQTSLPEILGQAAIYFNPYKEKEMQEKIIEVISNPDLRRDLINRGYEQVKKYSWEKCAEQTINAYSQILK